METIGERIKKLRLENKLTLEELAKNIGVSKTSLVKYENGTVKNLKVDIIEKLPKIFNVSTDYLTNGNIDNPEDKLIKLLIQKTIDKKIEWSYVNGLDNKPIDLIEYKLTYEEFIDALNLYCNISNDIIFETAKAKINDKNFIIVRLGVIDKYYILIYGKNIYNAYFIEDNINLEELYQVIFEINKYMEQQELKNIITDLENL